MVDVTAAGSECLLIPHGLGLAAAGESEPTVTVVDGTGMGWRHRLAGTTHTQGFCVRVLCTPQGPGGPETSGSAAWRIGS